jgi:hypothetical protein
MGVSSVLDSVRAPEKSASLPYPSPLGEPSRGDDAETQLVVASTALND